MRQNFKSTIVTGTTNEITNEIDSFHHLGSSVFKVKHSPLYALSNKPELRNVPVTVATDLLCQGSRAMLSPCQVRGDTSSEATSWKEPVENINKVQISYLIQYFFLFINQDKSEVKQNWKIDLQISTCLLRLFIPLPLPSHSQFIII